MRQAGQFNWVGYSFHHQDQHWCFDVCLIDFVIPFPTVFFHFRWERVISFLNPYNSNNCNLHCCSIIHTGQRAFSRAPAPVATSKHCGDSRETRWEDCVSVGMLKKMLRLWSISPYYQVDNGKMKKVGSNLLLCKFVKNNHEHMWF